MRPATRVLDAMKSLEQARHFFSGNAGAAITDAQLDRVAHLQQADGDLAIEGELEGVGEQVEDNLLPHVAVDEYQLADRCAHHVECEARAFTRRPEDTGQLGGECCEVCRLERSPHTSRFDARKIEQRVDETQQSQSVAIDDFQLTLCGGGEIGMTAREHFFDRTQHERQRSTELVADVREECRFRPVQFGQCLCLASLILECAPVRDSRRDGGGQQLEKVTICLRQSQPAADTGDQNANWPIEARWLERKRERRARTLGIRTARKLSESLFHIIDQLGLATARHRGQWPGHTVR